MDAQNIVDLITFYGLKIILAFVIFFAGKWIARRAVNVIKSIMTKAKVDPTLVAFTGNMLFGAAMAFVVIAVLNQVGVETTSLAAVIAAAGLAVGLALQGSLSNFAAGIMIILFRPFANGDFVNVNNVEGVVENISLFTTYLVTTDNKQVIVPNSTITDGIIINYSKKPTRRVDLVIGVGYDDDLAKTKKVLEKILSKHKEVLDKPEPQVAVSELGDSCVNFVVRPWVKTKDYWPLRFALLQEIKETLDKEGISIPYPQRDIHIINENAPAAPAKKATTTKKPSKKAAKK